MPNKTSNTNNRDSLPSEPAFPAAHLIERLGRLVRADGQTGDLNPAQWEALRFLARANRFSRSPAALAEYLGSTRGTVSQTLIALEAKRYVSKQRSTLDGRVILLKLTPRGQQALEEDALGQLARDISATGEAPTLASSLQKVLERALMRRGMKPFGACFTCAHFAPNAQQDKSAPYFCQLLHEPISKEESQLICMEQTDATPTAP